MPDTERQSRNRKGFEQEQTEGTEKTGKKISAEMRDFFLWWYEGHDGAGEKALVPIRFGKSVVIIFPKRKAATEKKLEPLYPE